MLNVIQMPCAPGNFRVGRRRTTQSAGIEEFKPEAIVIHIEQGSEAGTDAWFRDSHSHVSANYGMRKDGVVHQYVKEEDEAFHCGTIDRPTWPLLKTGVNPNLYTIGIEHEGRAGEGFTDEQYAATAELIAAASQRWGFPIDELHVVPHHAIRFSKSCPGQNVNLSRLILQAQSAAAPPLADQPS